MTPDVCGIPLLGPMTGRSRPHLSLREGLEQTPFPLALHRVGSVLAVKGTLRALDGSGPIRKTRCLRGERGGARSGELSGLLVHDKGYYHSCFVGAEAMHMIRKGQVRWVSGSDARRQIQFINRLFEVAA